MALGKAESVTLMEKGYKATGEEIVPEIAPPGANDRPDGRGDPGSNLKEYGGVPPVAVKVAR